MVRLLLSLIIAIYARNALASPCPLNELYKDTTNTRHIDWTFLKPDGSQATTSTGKKIAISYYDTAVPEFKWWTGTSWSTASSESANKLTMNQKSSAGEFYYLLPTSTTFWNSISDKIVDIRFIDDSVDAGMSTNCQVYVQPVNRFNDTVDTVTVGAISTNAITTSAIADGAITDAKVSKIRCDVTASTSGTSFTIASCTDSKGDSVSISANKFAGDRIEVYTNGGTTCNVNGQTGFITAMSAGGVLTLQNTTPPNQAFTAAPNTTNCGVIIK